MVSVSVIGNARRLARTKLDEGAPHRLAARRDQAQSILAVGKNKARRSSPATRQ